MKILKVQQEKVVLAAAPKVNPQYQFFKNMKKDVGINWIEVKDFKVTHVMHGGNPAQMYKKLILGTRKNSLIKQYDFSVNMNFVCTSSEDGGISEEEATIVLKSYTTNTTLAPWLIKLKAYGGSIEDMTFAINTILSIELGLTGKNVELPSAFHKRTNVEEVELPPMDIHGKEGYYYHRLTRIKTNAYHASVMELYILKHKFGYSPVYSVEYLEVDKKSGERAISSPLQLGETISKIDDSLEAARSKKNYVGPESPLYIPEGANKENWDFVLHKWKGGLNQEPNKMMPNVPDEISDMNLEPLTQEPPEPEEPEVIQPRKKVLDLKKLFGQAQDFEGYFEGEVPDVAGDYVGTGSVDASQISSLFSGTDESVSLVNSFTSDALKNVAYIFNFSKGGAYGVYIPALDRAIKTKALKRQLEQKGYTIVDESGVLTAHPTDGGSGTEQVNKDIESLWNQLNSGGGSALGINMSDVLNATEQNASTIMNGLRQEVPDIPPQVEETLKNVLGVYHLAAIILHEASHSKGGDEGQAQSDEGGFRNWAQSYLNQQYQSKLSSAGLDEFYSPLELSTETIHAESKDWYRTAQGMMGRLNYSPGAGTAPRGSDISGRYQGEQQGTGFAEWAMLAQQDQSIPIEQRLNRSKMSRLEPDVDPEHDIVEEQLRKQFKNDLKPNVRLITEELLMADHDETQGYKTLEVMLEDLRPQPLMIPLKKAASVTKTARAYNSLFGWHNNLEISDGSTIPGLSDRVMAWDDRDESFSGTEQDIKSQSRYNPTYDLKGFYYRWIEPRNKPQLFDDMTQDYSNVHPAKRFAATLDPTYSKMLSIIKLVEEAVVNERVKATRLVVSEDLLDAVQRLLGHEGLNLRAYKIPSYVEDNVFSIWVYGNQISPDTLDNAEQYFQNAEGSAQYETDADDILGGKSMVCSAIEHIVKSAKELCKEQDVNDLFILGEYARKIHEGEANPYVTELSFSCESVDMGLKIGSMLANKLHIPNDLVILGNAGVIFPYKGIRIFFSKSAYIVEIGAKMQKDGYNCEDPILRDICNKDFTVNMMAYNVRAMSVIDPIGVKADVDNKIVKTLFCPLFTVEANPMVIMRAMALKMDDYTLDEDLERAMIEGVTELSGGRFSPERMKFTKQYLKSKDSERAEALFGEYGLVLDEQEI